MAYFGIILYTVITLVRPYAWFPEYENLPLIQIITLFLLPAVGLSSHHNFRHYRFGLLVWLSLVIIVSAVHAGWAGGAISSMGIFASAALVPFAVYSGSTPTIEKQRGLFFFILLSSMVMVYHGYVQKTSPDGIAWTGAALSQGTRITYIGFLYDPNDLGMFLVMCLPLCGYMMSVKHGIKRLFYFGMLLALLYGVVMTNSRGTLLGTIAMGGLFFLRKYGLKRTVMLAAIMAPVVVIVMSSFRQISAEEESAHGRLEAWFDGMQMLLSSPILGVGFNNFTQNRVLTAHNSFVLVMAELGLAGYLAWFYFVGSTINELQLLSRLDANIAITAEGRQQLLEEQKVLAILLFSLIGYLITGYFLSRSYTLILYMFCGMALASVNRTLKIPGLENALQGKARVGFILFLALLSIVAIYMMVKVLI